MIRKGGGGIWRHGDIHEKGKLLSDVHEIIERRLKPPHKIGKAKRHVFVKHEHSKNSLHDDVTILEAISAT